MGFITTFGLLVLSIAGCIIMHHIVQVVLESAHIIQRTRRDRSVRVLCENINKGKHLD